MQYNCAALAVFVFFLPSPRSLHLQLQQVTLGRSLLAGLGRLSLSLSLDFPMQQKREGDFHSNNVSVDPFDCLSVYLLALLLHRSIHAMHPVAFANHLALLCTLWLMTAGEEAIVVNVSAAPPFVSVLGRTVVHRGAGAGDCDELRLCV